MTKETNTYNAPNGHSGDNQSGIDNHRSTARHLQEAAKHHLEAAAYYQSGQYEKVFESTIKAHGHTLIATDAQREGFRKHAVTNIPD